VTLLLSLIVLHSNYLALFSQACFYSGSLLGSLLSLSLLKALSTVKTLLLCIFVSSLYPIVFPISESWADWELTVLILILSFFCGVGSAIFLVVHALPLIKLQQNCKRSACIGAQSALLYFPGLVAGAVICLPSIFVAGVEAWLLSLIAFLLVVGALGVTLCIKNEDPLVSLNNGITLHHLSFFLSYFSIGVRFR
jgi:hypothetical protein